MRILLLALILLLLSLIPTIAAQEPEIDDACPTIVSEVLQEVGEICAVTARNQACYGNLVIEVVAREAVQFETIGDIVNVADLESLRMSHLEEASEVWGVALMRLQANLPQTLPGQNITFLLYGDVELSNAVAPENVSASPMQAFYLQTGVGNLSCGEVPESGVIIQTPDGVGEVTFSVNGVDISIGSTILFQAQPNGMMTISAIEGVAVASYGGQEYPVIAGTRLHIPMDANLLPMGAPSNLEAYAEGQLQNLPLALLDRPIEVAPALSNEQLQTVFDMLGQGLALCSANSFLPTCDHLPLRLGGTACQLDESGAFNCSLLRMFSWGQAGFGDIQYPNLWVDFEFDYEAIQVDNILADYGFDDLTHFTASLPTAVIESLNLDLALLAPEQLLTVLDTLGLRLGVTLTENLSLLANSPIVSSTVSNVTDTASNVVSTTTNVTNAVTNTLNTTVNSSPAPAQAVQETVTTVTDAVTTTVETTTETVTETVETVDTVVEETVEEVGSTVGNLLGGLLGGGGG